jgi:hypothetical protein
MQALGLVWENLVHCGRNVREIRTPIAEPSHFGARLLLEHWWDRQAYGGIVVGRDLPSRALGSILRNLAVYEPVNGGRDWRVRLAGSAFMRRFAREISGLNLSQCVAADQLNEHLEDIEATVETGRPIMHDVHITQGEKTQVEFETLHLRILAPRGAAAWVLGGVFYKDWA